MTTAPFTHAPRAPKVPEQPQHAYQRWFHHDGRSALSLQADLNDGCRSNLTVFRDSEKDFAEVTIRIGLGAAEITVRMTPQNLRDAAQLLLDAAHDIDTLPTAVLARQREGGAA